jgi:dinuclear metal center YbgI/SA1388 family protein
MTTVADLTRILEEIAPLSLAEAWDNVGLLLGDPGSAVDRVMTCLTVTAETAREAIEGGAQLIVSHHPILFRPVQKLTTNDRSNGFLWHLARAGVAVYSPHTAFDNAEDGINALLARQLGLTNIGPLYPSETKPGVKVVVFVPESDREAILHAAFEAGAGQIGNYSECSFSLRGQGTFFGDESSNPTVGQRERRESVEEIRLELICAEGRLGAVLAAVRHAHSYEEPAIDVYPLLPDGRGQGKGRIGDLAEGVTLSCFLQRVASTLPTRGLQWTGDEDRMVRRVGIACGAAEDFLSGAAGAGADVFLTGEARYHRALEANAKGLAVVLAGHHATERPGVEHLARLLADRVEGLRVWASTRESDPLQTRA